MIPEEELAQRVVMTADQCVIDNRFYYVRERFAIPIHGLDEPFIWGCRARLASADFFRTNQLWNDPARIQEPPYEALLNSALPLYGNTRNLPVRVQTIPVGRRPHFTPPIHTTPSPSNNGQACPCSVSSRSRADAAPVISAAWIASPAAPCPPDQVPAALPDARAGEPTPPPASYRLYGNPKTTSRPAQSWPSQDAPSHESAASHAAPANCRSSQCARTPRTAASETTSHPVRDTPRNRCRLVPPRD